MQEPDYHKILSGSDLRSKGPAEEVAASVRTQDEFDALFACMLSDDRVVAMRAADAVEKVTRHLPHFLEKHKAAVFSLAQKATNKEMLWHLAALVPRLVLQEGELTMAWDMLAMWARNRKCSRIVRAISVQSLSELLHYAPSFKVDFSHLLESLDHEPIPSLKARIRLIRKRLHKSGIF